MIRHDRGRIAAIVLTLAAALALTQPAGAVGTDESRWRKECQHGHYRLGLILVHGIDVKREPDAGLAWLRKAAEATAFGPKYRHGRSASRKALQLSIGQPYRRDGSGRSYLRPRRRHGAAPSGAMCP